MAFLLIPATVFTLVTLVLVVLVRIGFRLFRRPVNPGFWTRTFKRHGYLFVFHLFIGVPIVLAYLLTRPPGTRRDEARYEGPRIAEDGTWILQTRDSLAAEKAGKAEVAPAVQAAASARTVSLVARDGVKLRAFLVPPPAEEPRFVAVLVHGLYRGAMELETVGAMFRDLGGEVLLLEIRNHGGSAKARLTFGRDEALDVLAAAEFLEARPEARGRPLVVFAVSVGTAAAALAAPQITSLDGLVLDAPMDDLAATARRELKSGGFWADVREPWASTILLFAQYPFGVPVGEVKPREALARLSPGVAVLFIGAGHDERMPPDTVRALFESLPTAPDRKVLWIEPEATHGKVWVKAPEVYRRRLGELCGKVVAGG